MGACYSKRERFLDYHYPNDAHKYASIIQSHFRGYLSRKKFEIKKQENN